MWRDESGERRHKIHAAVVGYAGGQRFDIASSAHKLQSVAQPLHDGASDEYAAFERERRDAVALPSDRRQQMVPGQDRTAPGIEQYKTPGAIGVLREPRCQARLAEERRLLVAGD